MDALISIPWWVNWIVKIIPSPWGQIAQVILNIIQNLPAPQQAAVKTALGEAMVKGDHSILTGAIHEAAVNQAKAEVYHMK